ncbi:signal peptidase I [Siccirubricoccus phaeus]|uniref:signal peptidase I n=1 Tax=Siccirubricoccus phaeus TaxID=2595053 RepID=UPI0011F1F9C4|nr:signal peptidase I [Siccirubricoccus phaeus]
MAKNKSGGWLESVKTILYAGLIAIGIRTIAFEPFNIPSGSMIPTLLVGDYLFVSKYSYGYSRYSMPLGPNLFSGRILGQLPERGDVAVFKLPRDPSQDYIKRIIGLPGDRIQVRNGILHVNGQPVKRELVGNSNLDRCYGTEPKLYRETLPEGRVHAILECSDTNGRADNTDEYRVPQGYVFGMGDNRDNSQDSRFPEVGFIPLENLVGRAEFIFFSIDGSAAWWEVWGWPFAIRWSRLFSAIR